MWGMGVLGLSCCGGMRGDGGERRKGVMWLKMGRDSWAVGSDALEQAGSRCRALI